jgi:hypothetical protein
LSHWVSGSCGVQLEIVALCHQIGVLQRFVKRPKLNAATGAFVMKPSTALGWHHQGFRLFWIGKIRCGKQAQAGPVGGAGGSSLKLIGTMSSKNPRPETAVPDLEDVP